MKPWPRLALPLFVASLLAGPALAQGDTERLKAALAVIGLDMAAEAMITHCEEVAPAAASGLRPRWQQWRGDALVSQAAAALPPEKLSDLKATMSSVAASAVGKLQHMGPPQTVCPQIAGWLREGPFLTRTAYPAFYAGVPARAATSSSPPSATAPATAGGVYYTPAQLTSLVRSWWGPTNDHDRARRMLAQSGRLYIRGKVIKAGDHYFMEDNDGAFRSRYRLSTGLATTALAPFENQTIMVEARMKELPGSLVWLADARIVSPTGLKPSPLPAEPGLVRMQVAAAQISAAPGTGLKPAQVHGLLHYGYLGVGVGGSTFVEDVFLLLKDGTVYMGEHVAPSDLDVAKSRKLEPQLWGRWRPAGDGYQIQRQDDFGRPKGEWANQKGQLVPTWKPGQRLNATYTAKSFVGGIGLGGTYSSRAYRFTDDGRFEVIGFSQSGSGSMAAMNGFTASGAGYSDGKGSQASGGGGNAAAFAHSQTRSNDGSGSRGVYRLDGLTLELKFDNGRTQTVLCAPWSDDLKNIYMHGRTFSRS